LRKLSYPFFRDTLGIYGGLVRLILNALLRAAFPKPLMTACGKIGQASKPGKSSLYIGVD
jgi:hypothetical protein